MALAKEQNDITSSDVIVAIAIESYSYTWIATQSLCIAVTSKLLENLGLHLCNPECFLISLKFTLRFTSYLSIELTA